MARDHLTADGVLRHVYNYYRYAWLAGPSSRTPLDRGVWASSCASTPRGGSATWPLIDDRSRSEFQSTGAEVWARRRARRRPGHRRPPARLSARGQHPKPVSGVHRADPAGLGARREGGLGAVPCDAVLARPLLHGRGLPAARERKASSSSRCLFGTTWFVNALVFAGILLSVLLAIEVAKRTSRTPGSCTGYSRSPSPSPS
mgnify:CR=1 FL=1